MSGLSDLRTLLAEGGGLMAELLAPGEAPAREQHGPAALAAAGPRAEGHSDEYELLVEAIYEGYLLHYGEPRVLSVAEADLGLLAGDRLYAIGLARVVALGDTLAVAELADTITLSALAQGSGDGVLAEAVWSAGARAVGWGCAEQHEHAKQMVLAGAPEALEAMRTISRVPLPGPAAPR
ncbi:MAG TPA: hypothetical protein VGD00_04250 [Solirubrobacteraceae bacterium]|jgi:hypothetical protein